LHSATDSTLAQTTRFVRAQAARLLIISGAVLVPCFWHRHIEAGDLGSHVYNAWLVELIRGGHLPGLWVARQWQNVLFDWILSGLAAAVGLPAAEKIAVSISVLTFFWGAFAFVCAAVRRAAWWVMPLVAAVAYGWTFEMGFMNYYLSLGIAFCGLALFWRGTVRERLLGLAMTPLIWLAHPLGAVWLVATAAYLALAEWAPRRQIVLLSVGAGALVAVHFYLAGHFVIDRPDDPYWIFNGADQLLLFGHRYQLPAAAFLLFVVLAFCAELFSRRPVHSGARAPCPIALQLCALAELAVLLLPDGIHLPQYPAAAALLTERWTSVSAVLLCCLLAATAPRRLHVAASAAIAAVFFAFLYADTGKISRMETHAEELLRKIPANQRVMATIIPFPASRVVMQHIVDRACIGHCFSYGNYEAATGQFRVRANPGNPYLMADDKMTAEMEEGSYTVRPQDLPAWQLYQCSLAQTDLCIAPAIPDDDNDSPGVHPLD
jgi:hypothetical protein